MKTNRTAAAAISLAASAAAPAAQPAPADLPLTSLTLYRSGVGYFEHRGRITGDADVRLRFAPDRINDILKSLVLLDLGGGRVEAVGYDSDEPLERRLAGFALNIGDNPALWQVMDRLRGERLRLELPGRTVEGILISREQRTLVEDGEPVAQQVVNVLTDTGVQTAPIRRIITFEILDERLRAELVDALAAIAQHRDDDVQAVDLRFRGDGPRQVVVGYVHEMPVWKTSYRLVLGDSETGGPADAAARLQGWAIVENTTDRDWEHITLGLVAGRPVGFEMDLAQPLFIDRPDLPVPVEHVAAARAFERGRPEDGRSASGAPAARLDAESSPGQAAPELSRRFDAFEEAAAASGFADAAAIASAEQLGEVFRYTLDAPVTIERRRAAMLPIVSEPVRARRLSVYTTAGRSGPHPMRGARLENTTDLKLMPGPVAVFDAGTYAGDATIAHVAPGESRLLAYALDLDVTVDESSRTDLRTDSLRIVDGVLIRETSTTRTRGFDIHNADRADARTVVIETQDLGPEWELARPDTPAERTASAVRFELDLPPGGTESLEVVWRRVDRVRVELTTSNIGNLIALQQNRRAPQAIIDAAREAARLSDQIETARRGVAALETERAEITGEQARIRQNMQAVPRDSELYRRYLDSLSRQERRLETIAGELTEQREAVQRRREALEAFLRDLTVD